MTNGISAYRLASALPTRVAENRRPESDEPPPATAQATRHPDLSTEEHAMIDRYFPSSPEMSMRIYGPGRKTSNLNPAALGGRLDLRG